MTKEHLTPTIPSLPTSIISGHGGYYGTLALNTHNAYEELPSLGVTNEAIRQSVSNEPPGPYQSSLATKEFIPNANLLGFRPLSHRRTEAKNIAFDSGITQDSFPEYPTNTGLNLPFLYAISAYLSQNKTFKIHNINFSSLSENGSVVQSITQEPTEDYNLLEKLGDIKIISLFSEQLSSEGASIMYAPQLFKVANTIETANKWCCIDKPLQAWIDNRNARRNVLPGHYRTRVFESITQNGQQYRLNTIR